MLSRIPSVGSRLVVLTRLLFAGSAVAQEVGPAAPEHCARGLTLEIEMCPHGMPAARDESLHAVKLEAERHGRWSLTGPGLQPRCVSSYAEQTPCTSMNTMRP